MSLDFSAPDIGPIWIDRGVLWTIKFTFPSDYPSLTGVTATCQIRQAPDQTILATMTAAVDAPNRAITFTLAAANSLVLPVSVGLKSDVRLSWASGDVRYPARWDLYVKDTVTR